VDKLLDQAQTSIDEKEREDLYFQAQQILVDDAPWVPIAYAKPPVGLQDQVQGYYPNPTGGEPFNTVILGGGGGA
jgi:peptide/nickel transport system substrate-binding protein